MARFRFLHPVLLAALVGAPACGWATPVTVANPSFESPVIAAGTFNVSDSSGPAGWSVYNTTAPTPNLTRSFGVWNPTGTTSYLNGAPDGQNVGVVFLSNTTNLAEGGLQQTLARTLQLSTRYTLTIEVGNFSDAPPNEFNFTGFPGYRIELRAGGAVLASDNNTLQPGEGVFQTSTVSFTTGASHQNSGQALSIRLVNLNGAGTEVNFDNVRLDATLIPEPSAGVLGGGALAAVSLRRLRRRVDAYCSFSP